MMPWLAKEKRKLSAVAGSAALRADAAESALCAYLSVVALFGLGVNAILHVTWAGPVAALVIVPLILGRYASLRCALVCETSQRNMQFQLWFWLEVIEKSMVGYQIFKGPRTS